LLAKLKEVHKAFEILEFEFTKNNKIPLCHINCRVGPNLLLHFCSQFKNKPGLLIIRKEFNIQNTKKLLSFKRLEKKILQTKYQI